MIRVGIVGAGLRGLLFARALADSADVVGLADPSPAGRAAATAAGHPVFDDHQQLLADRRPDAVIVATPDFAHREPAVAAARSGAHLLVEKPLAMTVADAHAIRDAVEESGVSCMVGFENRWNPHFLQLQQSVADGELGRPISQSVALSNTTFVPTQLLSWAERSSPVWFLMPHVTDLACWLSGATPASVFARGRRGVLTARGIDTWDVVDASVEFDDGGLLHITSAWVLPESGPGIVDFTYQLIGTAGSAKIDLGQQGLTMNVDKHRSVWPLNTDVNARPIGTAPWMVEGFVRALEAGRPPVPDIHQGVIVTETLAAVDRSLACGHPVTLDDVRDQT